MLRLYFRDLRSPQVCCTDWMRQVADVSASCIQNGRADCGHIAALGSYARSSAFVFFGEGVEVARVLKLSSGPQAAP